MITVQHRIEGHAPPPSSQCGLLPSIVGCGSLMAAGTPIDFLGFSARCRFAASGSIDGTIRVWDIVDGKEAGAFAGHTAAVWGVCYTPDGMLIASASSDKTVR